MELYIFNKDLEFQGIIDLFTSLRWVRRYYKCGEFELHCSLTPENLDLLKKENIIYKKDDDEAGYINYRNLKQDQNGQEILVVKGKFLTGYLNRRIVSEYTTLNLTTEIAMRTLVNSNCITTTVDRIIPNLILGDFKSYSHLTTYQTGYKNLADELEKLSNISDLGHRVKFDISNKKLIFHVYKGLDRSVNQSTNPPAIFSKEFENVLEQEYTDSLNNYRNFAYIKGEDGRVALLGDSTGLDRYEVLVDGSGAKSTTPTTVYFTDGEGGYQVITYDASIPDSEYLPLLREEGKTALADMCEVETFNSKTNIYSNLKYKVDFNLGDIVTCTSKKWGITLDTRITEIEEIYEEQVQQVNVVFGNNVPTLIDVIKQKIK